MDLGFMSGTDDQGNGVGLLFTGNRIAVAVYEENTYDLTRRALLDRDAVLRLHAALGDWLGEDN